MMYNQDDDGNNYQASSYFCPVMLCPSGSPHDKHNNTNNDKHEDDKDNGDNLVDDVGNDLEYCPLYCSALMLCMFIDVE